MNIMPCNRSWFWSLLVQFSDHALVAIQIIVEFIFLGQSLLFYNEHIFSLWVALPEFHKPAIQGAGGHIGKNGTIDHWNIPKLELMNSIANSTILMGVPYQWTSNSTKQCHIMHVKIPYHSTNHRNFHKQCCQFIDQIEKCCGFHLYTIVENIPDSEQGKPPEMVVASSKESIWKTHLSMDMATKSRICSQHSHIYPPSKWHLSASIHECMCIDN